MKQLLIRFWRWLGQILGLDAAPPYRETDGLPRPTAPPVSPPPTLVPVAPPSPPLPPPRPPELALQSSDPAQFSYKSSILTKSEGLLYRSLMRAVDGRYQVMSKVRLWDFIWLDNYPAERRHILSNLSCRHVDFLLCEPDTLRPRLVIELDDYSHKKPEARAADQFKNELFRAAGLPLLRLDHPNYPPRRLRELIAEKLATDEDGSQH